MPTYEFRCPQGHLFERFFSKISDGLSEVACPECGQQAIRQLSGGAGLLFKGSGFYLTDYGKNAHRGTGSAPKGDTSSDAASKSESKSSESKGGEAKSTESKSSESKSSESKSSESKSSESKPAPGKPKASGSGDS